MKKEPKLKKFLDEARKRNPYISFIWSYELRHWGIEWNYRENPTSDMLLKLIAQLDIEKAKIVDYMNMQSHRRHEKDGNYQKLDEEEDGS